MPRGVAVEQVGPGEAEDEDRGVPGPAEHVLDQLDEGRLRPLEVVEAHDQRPLARDVLEQPTDGPHRLFRRGRVVAYSDRRGHLARDPLSVRFPCEQLVEPAPTQSSGGVANDVPQGPVCDPLAVGEAAANEHRRLVAYLGQELLGQPGLADARGAENRHESRGLIPYRLLERGAQLRKLVLSPDHRSVEAARECGSARDNPEQPPGPDWFALALQVERIERLCEHRVAHEPMGRVSDQDLAGARRRFEALRDDDGLTRDERVASGRISGDDLPRVDPGPCAELDPVLRAQLLVQRPKRLPHLAGGADGPQRVVLVDDRDAERGHDRVADELLDRAAVVLEDAADLDEVARDDSPVGLRVEALAEWRRVDDVGENDRDRLPHLARRGRLLHGSPTREAEPCASRVGLATSGTGGHVLTKYGTKAPASTPKCRRFPGASLGACMRVGQCWVTRPARRKAVSDARRRRSRASPGGSRRRSGKRRGSQYTGRPCSMHSPTGSRTP